MKPKTEKEIQREIKSLEACKKYVGQFTSFGENNHTLIDLQIDALKFPIDSTCEEWWDWSDRERDAMIQAQDWKDGFIQNSPSSDWENSTWNRQTEQP